MLARWNSEGNFESIFKQSTVSSEAKGIFKDIDDLDLNSKTIAWDKWADSMVKTDKNLKAFLITEDEAYKTKDLATYTQYLNNHNKTLDVATLKTKALALAKNMAVNAAIGLAMYGVNLLIEQFDKWIVTTEESREALANLKSECQTIESDLNAANDELKTTGQRMGELEGKGTLTFTEKEEYDNLVKQNNELERTVALLELEQKIKNKEKNKTFVETMEKDTENPYEYEVDPDGKHTGGQYHVGDEYLTSEIGYIEAQFKIRKQLLDDLSKAETKDEQDRIQSRIDEINTYLQNKNTQWASDMEGIEYIDNPSTEDEKNVNKWLDFINDFQDRMAIAMGGDTAEANAFNRVVDNWQFDDVVQELQDLGKEGKVTAEMLDDTKYDEFIQKLVYLGIIDSADNLDDIALAFNNVGTEAKGSGAGVDEMTVSLTELEKASDKIKTLGSAVKELHDDGYITIKTLNEMKTASGLSAEEWAKYENTLLSAKSGSAEFNQAMSDLTYSMLDNTFAGVDLANVSEEYIASVLEENGVINASAVAHDYLKRKKAELKAESLLSKINEDDFADSLTEVADECGLTTDAIADMMLKMIMLDSTRVDFSQQIDEIKKLREAMNLVGDIDDTSLGIVAKQGTVGIGYSYNGKWYNSHEEARRDALADQSFKDFSANTTAPVIPQYNPSGKSQKDLAKEKAEKLQDYAEKVADINEDIVEAEADYAEKVSDIHSDLAEKEADFAENMAEAWKEEHLEQLKDGLAEQKDIIDRYKKNVEVIDFGLEHIETDDFFNRTSLVTDKLNQLKSYGAAMRAEFDRVANTIPQTGEEATELANRLEELGSDMRSNVTAIRETVVELQKINIDMAATIIDDRMSELQSELDNIDKQINILNSSYKDEYRYASNVLSMDMLLPVYSEFDEKRRAKQRSDKALIKTEQETQDKINKIVSDALEQQSKDNAAAREKERQNLIKDMEKARQEAAKKLAEAQKDLENARKEAAKKLAEAHKDYKEFLEDNEIATDDSIENIEKMFKEANIELPEVDATKLEESIEEVIENLSKKTVDITVNAKEGSYQPGGGGTPSSSTQSLSNSQAARNIQGGNKCVKYAYARAKEITGYKGNIWYSGNGGDLGDESLGSSKIKSIEAFRDYLTPGSMITMTSSNKYGHVIVVESYDPYSNTLYYSDNYTGTTAKGVDFDKFIQNGGLYGGKLTGLIPAGLHSYAKGTKSHPGGFALYGDENLLKGSDKPAPELAIYPDGTGEVLGANGAEIGNLPKGTQVIPAKQTKSLLGNMHSYADGTGNVKVVDFNFDEWYKSENYLVDSFDDFVRQIDIISQAYSQNTITESKVLEAVKLLTDSNKDMIYQYAQDSQDNPDLARKYGKYIGEEGKDRWQYDIWDIVNGLSRDETSGLYNLIATKILDAYAPLIEANAAKDQAIGDAHNSLPYAGSGVPTFEQSRSDARQTDFGGDWLLNNRAGKLISDLVVGSVSYQNAIEYKRILEETGVDNGFGKPYQREDGTWGYRGISNSDVNMLTMYGNTLGEMRSSSAYQIDGTSGENALRLQADAYRTKEGIAYSKTGYSTELSAAKQFYRDNLILFNRFPVDKMLINSIDDLMAPIVDLEGKIESYLNDLSSSDPEKKKKAIEGITETLSLINEAMPGINAELATMLNTENVGYSTPTSFTHAEIYGENDWGKYHPMLTGLTPEDIVGTSLTLDAKAAYDYYGYDNVIVGNDGKIVARLTDGVSDEELLQIATLLAYNATGSKQYLGGIGYKKYSDGTLMPSEVIKNYSGWYGTEDSYQWMDTDGTIYTKGVFNTSTLNISDPSTVMVTDSKNVTLPQEYEDAWNNEVVPQLNVSNEVANSIFAQKLVEQGITTVRDTNESNNSSSGQKSGSTKGSENPYIAEAEGFYQDAVNRIAKEEAKIIARVQNILNDRSMSDFEKSQELYKLKNEAGGEASKIGAEIYQQILDSFYKWKQDVDSGIVDWNLEVYESYRDILGDISDLTYDMANSAVESKQAAANARWGMSEDWIADRNFYNDWELFGDSEVKAWERVVKWLNQDYPEELDKIKQAEQKLWTARKTAIEKSISDEEDYISARNHYNDWDKYGDSEIKAIARITRSLEEALKQRLISYEEYAKKMEGYSQRIYSLGQNRVDMHLSNIDKYIDARNLYNDWDKYGDSEIKAIKRQLITIEEGHKLKLISYEKYTEQTAQYTQKLYSAAKNTISTNLSELLGDYEKVFQFKIQQYESQSTLLQSHFGVINAVNDAQHEINKELSASKSMFEYLDEDTRKLLFNQDDHDILTGKLSQIRSAASELQEQYNKDIANASEETIGQITEQYQRQYEILMKKYEIAKAELDVAKKRQKLDNVLAERNVRMFINGQWQWVANTQDVIAAQNELADAEYEKAKKESSLDQTNAINNFADQINYAEIGINFARTLFSQMQEKLDGDPSEVSEVIKEISDVTSPELKRIIETTGEDAWEFSGDLSECTSTISTIITSDLPNLSSGIGTIILDLQNYSDALQFMESEIKGNKSKGKGEVNYIPSTKSKEEEDIAKMKANSEKWNSATTQEERDALHEENDKLGKGMDANYDPDSGKWYGKDGNELYSVQSSSSKVVQVKSDGNAPSGTGVGDVVKTAGGDYVVVEPGTQGSTYNPLSGLWSIKIKEKDADGTRYTSGGMTLMGEEELETLITNNGRLIPINQPTLGNVGAGGIVFNREQMSNLRNLWDLSNLSKISPFVSTSNANSQSTTIDNSIHINGMTIGEKGNEDWINGLRRYVATHK